MVERIELHTERLLLRPFRLEDVEDALVYRNDPEFARFLAGIPIPFTRRHAEEFVARNVLEPWDKYPTFAIVFDGRVIGNTNLVIDTSNQVGTLGYAIGTDLWGKGIAPEAARAVIEWGFKTYGLSKMSASADARNERSWRVMEKLGMRREGVLRSHSLARGERVDDVHYGLLREEWEALYG